MQCFIRLFRIQYAFYLDSVDNNMDSEEFRSRARAGTYSRPSLGEEPRPMLTVRGTRMAPSSHADEREEDELEGRFSMDS